MAHPSDLEVKALAQFDRLVEADELQWSDIEPRYVSSAPFHFQFRVTSSLKRKPMTAGQQMVKDAFADEDPDFDLGAIGPNHKLILNKFCVVRPQFVLPTIGYESQDKVLNKGDLGAAWKVLSGLKGDYMAIYNCGVDGGASVGHKHMQIIPHPGQPDFELFPDRATLPTEGVYVDKNVPFQHAILKLSSVIDEEKLHESYRELAAHLSMEDNAPHNMILVKRWMLIVPRTLGRFDGISAGASTMVGMVWLTTEEQYHTWTEGDPMTLLTRFGIPTGGSP